MNRDILPRRKLEVRAWLCRAGSRFWWSTPHRRYNNDKEHPRLSPLARRTPFARRTSEPCSRVAIRYRSPLLRRQSFGRGSRLTSRYRSPFARRTSEPCSRVAASSLTALAPPPSPVLRTWLPAHVSLSLALRQTKPLTPKTANTYSAYEIYPHLSRRSSR